MSSKRSMALSITAVVMLMLTEYRALRFVLLRLDILLVIPIFVVTSFYYVQGIIEYMKYRITGKNLAPFDISNRWQIKTPTPIDRRFTELPVQDGFWSLSQRRCVFAATSGRREYMEDRMRYRYDPKLKLDILSLFDGHGGNFVSDYLEENLVPCLHQRLKRLKSRGQSFDSAFSSSQHPVIEAVMTEVWRQDDAISGLDEQLTQKTGSTMICILLEENRFLTVANVGDSRAVACDSANRVVPLSIDHKPDRPSERRRVELNGGFVRSLAGAPRVQGVLAVSRFEKYFKRSFGDTSLKRLGVITANPDVTRIDLRRRPLKHIIVATDGFWDVVSNKCAVQLANKYLWTHGVRDWRRIARYLVRYALAHGSEDNISVAFIHLL